MKKLFYYSALVLFFVFLPIFLISAVGAPVSIMPLGDSITEGSSSGAKQGEEVSYRKALRDKLIAAGYEIIFVGSRSSGGEIFTHPNHEGHGGWCASGCYTNHSDILRKVDTFLSSSPPDIVLLHIGTNDINAGKRPQAIASAVNVILDKIYRYGRKSLCP